MISFTSFYATWYKKTHLNVCIIFAGANNLNLSVLVLLFYCGDFERNPGPVSNYADVWKHVKQTEHQLNFIDVNCRSLNCKRGDLKTLLGDSGHNSITGST